jgi:hypothetical protein
MALWMQLDRTRRIGKSAAFGADSVYRSGAPREIRTPIDRHLADGLDEPPQISGFVKLKLGKCAPISSVPDGFFERANLMKPRAGNFQGALPWPCSRKRLSALQARARRRGGAGGISRANHRGVRLRNLEARKSLLFTMETMGCDGTRNLVL